MGGGDVLVLIYDDVQRGRREMSAAQHDRGRERLTTQRPFVRADLALHVCQHHALPLGQREALNGQRRPPSGRLNADLHSR